MGIDTDFGRAFAKAQLGAGQALPLTGTIFISVSDRDKPDMTAIAKDFLALGFKLLSTEGTQRYLRSQGLAIEKVLKVHEGRPHIVDVIKNQEVHLIVNTPSGNEAQQDAQEIRRTAITYKVPLITTLAGARATVAAIRALQVGQLEVRSIQEYHGL